MQRRTMLGVLGSATAIGLAGCLGNGDDDDDDNGEDIEITGSFQAESTEGLVYFGTGSEDTFRTNGHGLPPSGEITTPVTMEAEIHDDGTWESDVIDFPPLDIGELPDDIETSVEAPNGFTGEFDQDEGLWTVDGDLRVSLTTGGGQESTLDFPLSATTQESGGLTGSFEVYSDRIEATIVDNESIVEDEFEDLGFVNDTLNIPHPFENENWFELSLVMEND